MLAIDVGLFVVEFELYVNQQYLWVSLLRLRLHLGKHTR